MKNRDLKKNTETNNLVLQSFLDYMKMDDIELQAKGTAQSDDFNHRDSSVKDGKRERLIFGVSFSLLAAFYCSYLRNNSMYSRPGQ